MGSPAQVIVKLESQLVCIVLPCTVLYCIYIYISQRPFVSHVFTSSLVFFVLLLSLLRRASSSSSSLVFFDDPQSSLMLLSLLRRSSSSSSSSFSFFSFFSEVQRDMLSFRRLIVEWAPLSCKLPFIVPGRAWPGLAAVNWPITSHSVHSPKSIWCQPLVNGSLHNGLFILLKSICAEGLTRRHETECRHATRVRSSRFYMLLILRHISHNIYCILYRNILYHNTVQYSTVQYSTVQYSTVRCKKRDGGKGRREGKKGTRLGFLLGYIAYVAQLNPC